MRRKGQYTLQLQILLVANLFLVLSVPNQILVCCAIYAQFPLINVYFLVVRVAVLVEVFEFFILTVLGSQVQFERLYNKKDRVYKEERRLYKTQSITASQLSRLKKVYEKLRSKKHSLHKQSVQELKADKQKKLNSLEVELLSTLITYQLPQLIPLSLTLFF